MSTEEVTTFDLNQFYDILMSISIKDKLKPMVKQFKKKNIPFIYETIVNLLQVLNSKKETPLMKFNALMATKLFFDTGEYVPVVLIQIYLLPIIYEVATYRIQKRSEEGLTLYFIEKGYDSTKEMKRIGFNYVLLALEFTFMSALVKPYRNLENQQLEQASNYAKLAKMLLEKGVQTIQSYKFYIPSYVNQTRKRFIKKISKFNSEEYVDFFLKLTCDQINLNKKAELDLKKIISYGDAYFTIPLMNVCEDELTNMETNFTNKKKYLNLLGEFMKGGDIYAVLIITRSTFLESIYDKVQMVKGQIGFEAGEKIYPEVEAPKSQKKEFYIQFLKHIQIWAYCHPIDEDGDPTDSKKIFDVLKTHKKFVFPPNILLNKIKAQMQTNLKLNNTRNQKMIKLVDDLSSFQSRKKASMEMRESRASRKSDKNKGSVISSFIEFDQLEETVLKAKNKLDLICQANKLPQTIEALKKFKKYWETVEERNQIDADQSDDIEIVIEQGSLTCKIIELVLPVYELYEKKAISFEEYLDRVSLLMKSDEQSDKMQASIERHLQADDLSIQDVSTVKEQSQKQESESKIQNFQQSNSNGCNSKIKKSESQYQLQSKINSEVSNKQSNLIYPHRGAFNDYQVEFSEQSIKEIAENAQKAKMFQKKPSGIIKQHSERSSLRSSRSNKSIRNSRNILNRRQNNKKESTIHKNTAEPQYKDILQPGRKNWDEIINQNQSKESFISSEHSSVKENKNKSQVSFSSKQKKQSQIHSHDYDIKVNNPSIEDYYGNHADNKNSYVGFGSSSSSKVKLQNSKKLKIKPKQSSIRQSREDHSEVNSYNQNSFRIQSDNKESQINKSSRSSGSKKESRFTFTSKDDKKQSDPPLSLLSKLKEDSIIDQPDLKPLLQSFHEGKEQEEVTTGNPSKITTFKDCFNVNNEIISSKEGKQAMFKFQRGKIVNFIQTVYSKSTSRNSSIADMISERNARQTIQEYKNERQKNRQIQTQSERVRSLESFNKNLRMKFIVKRQQQNQERVQLRQAQNNQSQPVSFYQSSQCSMRKSQTNLNLKIKTCTREFADIEPQIVKTRVINSNIYHHYFPQSKCQKIRKCLLKTKSLLIKNEEFQIGYVSTKRQNGINITLFITPLKDNIQDVNLLLAHDQNVTLKLSVNYIEEIKINMQESVSLIVGVDNVPFVLPSLNLKFKKNKKYSHNQMLITIPCSFNKFVDFHKFSGQLPQPLNKSTKNEDKICIQDFKFSSKMFNTDKIRQTLNNFSLIEQERHANIYASEIYFRGKIFLMKVSVQNNGKMSIEGTNMTGDHKNVKFLQFLMITFQNIFKSSKIK